MFTPAVRDYYNYTFCDKSILFRMNKPRNPGNKTQRSKGHALAKKSSFFTKVIDCFSGYFDLVSTLLGALPLTRQYEMYPYVMEIRLSGLKSRCRNN